MDELFEVLVLKSYGQLNQRVLICNMEKCYETLLALLREQGADEYVEVFTDVEEFINLIEG